MGNVKREKGFFFVSAIVGRVVGAYSSLFSFVSTARWKIWFTQIKHKALNIHVIYFPLADGLSDKRVVIYGTVWMCISRQPAFYTCAAFLLIGKFISIFVQMREGMVGGTRCCPHLAHNPHGLYRTCVALLGKFLRVRAYLHHQIEKIDKTIFFSPLISQILCDCETTEISHDHNEESCCNYDSEHMGIAGIAFIYSDIRRMVHNRRAQRVHKNASGRMWIRSESSVCGNIELNIILDPMHHHDIHLFGNISWSKSPRKAIGNATR